VSSTDPFEDRMADQMQRLVDGTDASELVRVRIERGLQQRPVVPRSLILWGSVAAAVAALIAPCFARSTLPISTSRTAGTAARTWRIASNSSSTPLSSTSRPT